MKKILLKDIFLFFSLQFGFLVVPLQQIGLFIF